MFKHAEKTFTNVFGHEERYEYKTLEQSLSGHLYRGSAIETDTSCGNCDGARCDYCKVVTKVTMYSEPEEEDQGWGFHTSCKPIKWRIFDDVDEAIDYYNSL